MLTEQEVMKKLGIEKAMQLRGGGNRAGRTAKLLVETVVVASGGKEVCIVGQTPSATDELIDRARSYCHICGVDPALIVPPAIPSFPSAVDYSKHLLIDGDSSAYDKYVGLKISRDGNMWCVLFGQDLQSGIAGFGKTLLEAIQEFDKSWLSASRTKRGE